MSDPPHDPVRVTGQIARVLAGGAGARGPVAVVLFVSLARSLGEWAIAWPGGQQSLNLLSSSLLVVFAQSLSFYALGFWLFSGLLAVLLRRRLDQVAPIAAVGLLAGVVPPIIDGLLGARADEILYNYGPTGDLLFTSDVLPPGETVAIWSVIIATFLFVLYVTRSIPRAVVAFAGGWVVMQFMISWEVEAIGACFAHASIAAQRIIYLGVTLLVFVGLRRRTLWPTLLRINHALPAGLAALAGSLWVGNDWLISLGLAGIMIAIMGIVIGHNDWYDRAQDAHSGRPTAVSEDDATWLWFFSLAGVMALLLWSQVAAWLVALYLMVAVLYHLPGIRLKRIFCVAYQLEGIWGAIAFLVGAKGAPATAHLTLDGLILWPLLLTFGGYALVSGLKDYKDIAADDAARVYTYYTLAKRRGVDPRVVHRGLVAAAGAGLVLAPLLLGLFVGWHPLLLSSGALAAPPMIAVISIRDPTAAVETMFWLLAPYLLAVAVAMNALSPFG